LILTLERNENSSQRDELTGELKKFYSTVNALNYMAVQGWTLVSIPDDRRRFIYISLLFQKEIQKISVRLNSASIESRSKNVSRFKNLLTYMYI